MSGTTVTPRAVTSLSNTATASEGPTTRTWSAMSRPRQGPATEVTAARDKASDAPTPEPGGRGEVRAPLPRIAYRVSIIRAAALSSRDRGSRPLRTARTTWSRASLGSGGINKTSAPARNARTAATPPRACACTPSMSRASVTTRPSKPISRRSRPLVIGRETLAGTSASRARTAMCPVITAGAWARIAAANGTRSVARSSGIPRRCTGSARWLSTSSEPWPGKCFTTGSTPADSMPSIAATTCRATRPGRPPAAREPTTASRSPTLTSAYRRQHHVETKSSHLGCADPRGPAGQRRVVGRARGHERRERRDAQVDSADHSTLLVDGDECGVPPSSHDAGDRAVHPTDLRQRGDVRLECHDATEVQPADHGRGRPRSAPSRHDHLPRLLPQAHPRDCRLSPGRLGSSASVGCCWPVVRRGVVCAVGGPRGASAEHHDEQRGHHRTTSRRGQQHLTSLSARPHRGVPTQESAPDAPQTGPRRRDRALTRAPLQPRSDKGHVPGRIPVRPKPHCNLMAVHLESCGHIEASHVNTLRSR